MVIISGKLAVASENCRWMHRRKVFCCGGWRRFFMWYLQVMRLLKRNTNKILIFFSVFVFQCLKESNETQWVRRRKLLPNRRYEINTFSVPSACLHFSPFFCLIWMCMLVNVCMCYSGRDVFSVCLFICVTTIVLQRQSGHIALNSSEYAGFFFAQFVVFFHSSQFSPIYTEKWCLVTMQVEEKKQPK